MSLAAIFDQLGLPALFALGLFDGEAAALLGGALSHHGLLRTEYAALTVSSAAAVSDNILFGAGRLSERISRLGAILRRPSISALRARIERHPAAAVLSTRFLYGLHGLGTMAIGASPVAWVKFAALNALTVAVWAHLWVWGGQVALGLLHRLLGIFALELSVLAVAAAVLAIHWHGRQKIRPRRYRSR